MQREAKDHEHADSRTDVNLKDSGLLQCGFQHIVRA